MLPDEAHVKIHMNKAEKKGHHLQTKVNLAQNAIFFLCPFM